MTPFGLGRAVPAAPCHSDPARGPGRHGQGERLGMARLIVHIGAPAAGAAPLQIRLARRAEALERAGACWLDASDLAGGRPNLDAMVKLSGRGEAFRARIGLRRALALCKPRAEICLGSSERLWWLDDPALIAGFAEGLRKVYERIDIVACLPRQDRMLVAQRAPAAAQTTPLPLYTREDPI